MLYIYLKNQEKSCLRTAKPAPVTQGLQKTPISLIVRASCFRAPARRAVVAQG
jgi:hypothetical protein